MKKIAAISLAAMAFFGVASSASANWFGNNGGSWFGNNNGWGNSGKCWGRPYDQCNPYDEWDPRYWMWEMSNGWDNNNDYGPYGYGGYGPYGYGPYGYGMPYGGGYGAPYGAPMPYRGSAPYGAPMPYGAPPMHKAPAPAQSAPPATK